MAIYEFQCQDGHVTEVLVSLADRPAEVDCEVCGAKAPFVVSAVRTTFHAADRKAIKGATISRGGTRT